MPQAFPTMSPGPAAPVASAASLPAAPPTDNGPTYLSAVPAPPPVAEPAPVDPLPAAAPGTPAAPSAFPVAAAPPQSIDHAIAYQRSPSFFAC